MFGWVEYGKEKKRKEKKGKEKKKRGHNGGVEDGGWLIYYTNQTKRCGNMRGPSQTKHMEEWWRPVRGKKNQKKTEGTLFFQHQ